MSLRGTSTLPKYQQPPIVFRFFSAKNYDLFYYANLTTIAGPWYFGRVLVPLRLKNQSLYHKILLLQKFNDISGKVLKPKKIQPPTSKKN